MFRMDRQQEARLVNSGETRSQSDLQRPSWQETMFSPRAEWNKHMKMKEIYRGSGNMSSLVLC